MRELVKPMQKNQYGQYLLKVIDEMKEEINSNTFTHPEMSEIKKIGLIRLETIGINNINIPKICEFKIIIINENKVQLSFNHIFPYNSDPYEFDKFVIKKKEGIKNIKKYLENNDNEP